MRTRVPFAWTPTAVLALASLLAVDSAAAESGRTLAHSMPGGAIGYVELSGLGSVIERIHRSSYLELVTKSAPFHKLERSKGYRRAQAGRKIAETQLGLDLWTLSERLLGDRVAIGLYPREGREKPDVVGILRVPEAATLAHVRERIDPFLVLGSDRIERSETVTGVEVLGIDDRAFVAMRDRWVAASSSRDLLERTLELLTGKQEGCLAGEKNFRAMAKQAGSDHLARVYVDVEAIRRAQGGRFIPEKLDNPLGSLLVGGILELAVNSPYLEAHVDVGKKELSIAASVAGETEKLDEAHRAFFSRPADPGTPPLPAPPRALGGLTIYRDFTTWYRNRENLLQENVLPGFDKFESGLANLLPGKDFGEDILPLIGNRLTFVSARQDYENLDGKPGLQLPGFALVIEMKEPRKAARIFRLFFQTLSAVLNIQAGQQGREPWVMTSETHEGVQISYGEYLKRPSGERLGVVFNFMPASALVEDKFVISSSLGLCRQLVTELKKPPRETATAGNRNLNFEVYAAALADMIEANTEFFEAESIKAGRTQQQAAEQFAQILKLVRNFDFARLSTRVLPAALQAGLEVHWR